jgi:hypothetical protein
MNSQHVKPRGAARGLAIAITADAGMVSVRGSTIGMTYARKGRDPEMLTAGYDGRVTVGSILIGGLVSQFVPPSIISGLCRRRVRVRGRVVGGRRARPSHRRHVRPALPNDGHRKCPGGHRLV